MDAVGRKALEMIEAGRVSEPHQKGDVFLVIVTGDTRTHVVTVAPVEEGDNCTDCKGFEHRRRCSHVLAARTRVAQLRKEENDL